MFSTAAPVAHFAAAIDNPGITVEGHPTSPLAGIPEVLHSAKGVATGFSSHPLSYRLGAFPAGGCKQGCFQPP